MAAWELALLIFAITYLMVNTVYLVIQIKLMNKMSGVMTKSFKMVEKIISLIHIKIAVKITIIM